MNCITQQLRIARTYGLASIKSIKKEPLTKAMH